MRLANFLAAAGLMALAAAPALAEVKIGFVNADRVMKEAAPAAKAQKRLEKEFEKRDQDLQRMGKQLEAAQANLEKNGLTMGEADRHAKEQEVANLNRDYQRRQREFREDLNQRKNEELAAVLEKANKTIRQIAEADKFDIIIQEAVYFSPRIDITEKVIKALADTK